VPSDFLFEPRGLGNNKIVILLRQRGKKIERFFIGVFLKMWVVFEKTKGECDV
jgi:hypothetical protein